MDVLSEQVLPLVGQQDVVHARQAVRKEAEQLKFGLVDLTKLVTATSELARNTVVHGGGGTMRLEVVSSGHENGLRLTFMDEGPGIADIELAMRDGYTTGHGLGLGLGGSKRLVNEFSIESKPGKGTCITVTRWK
jgi:serine/threonine-protein kinase RsbT